MLASQRLTILSPHRDDAAFSLSIALRKWSRLPVRIEILNLFTRSGYAPWVEDNDPSVISAIRREEDRAVLSEISADIEVHDRDFLDAPLRTGLQVDQVCDIQNAVLIGEEIVQALQRVFTNNQSELILAPLALGDHIDHIAVRQAALRTFPALRLGFYEDLPYATWTPEEALQKKVDEAANALRCELHSFVVADAVAAQAKAQTIAGYKSQITMGEADSMAARSEHFGGGERIWAPASTEWHLLTG